MRSSLDWNRSGLMASRISGLVGVLSLVSGSRVAQEMHNPQAMQMQVQQIMQQRPHEAEAAARAFLRSVAPDRVAGLDSLRDHANNPTLLVEGNPIGTSDDQYWMEIAQLAVQFDMVQRLSQ